MKPRTTNTIEEFLENLEDEDVVDYEQIRPRHDDSMDRMDEDVGEQIRPRHDDSMDRMDEDVGELLHVEEV